MHRLLLLTGFLLTSSAALAQLQSSDGATEPIVAAIDYNTVRFSRNAEATRTNQEIAIDGRLDETAWQTASPAGDFVQWEPSPGEEATEPTEVRFLYDDVNLYIGVICYESDLDNLRITELDEDFNGQDNDGFGITLDTLKDERSGFFFGTNPAGAKRDMQIANDGFAMNQDWDGVWDVRVTLDGEAWIAEFVIPLKTLRFANDGPQEWGLNMVRRVRRKNEDSHWSPLPRRYRVNRISMLGTLRGVEVGSMGPNLKVKPFATTAFSQIRTDGNLDSDTDFDGGLDAKYGVTSSLTLDMTYRTDFSQVEADQQQVNLTRFSLFFPEKREFFLENSGIFGFGQPLNRFRGGNRGGGGDLIPFFSRRIGLDSGSIVPIVGGARLTGQAGSYDIGTLVMKTESIDSAPSTNYVVGRVKKNILGNSWIGAIATSRDSSTPEDYSRLYGIDSRFRLLQKLEIGSYLLESDTPGKEGQNRAQQFESAWLGDDVTVTAGYFEAQKNFNPEMGFMPRGDIEKYSGNVNWRPRVNSHGIRNLFFGSRVDYFQSSSQNEMETRRQNFNGGISFLNNAFFNFNVNRGFERLLEPFDIRDDIEIPAGDYHFNDINIFYNSDRSKAIGGNVFVNFGDFWNGTRRSIGGELALKPNYRLNIQVNYNRNKVDLVGGSFVTDLLGSRIKYSFNTRMFLNAFLQYNTDAKQFSSNIRFRLIHHPLSDLFIVYNDRRDTQTGELLDRAIIFKFTNLFNF